jgi:hypothetical protein
MDYHMRVRIYRPAKSSSQSGRAKTHTWLLEPEILTSRTPEPIMGWSSAGDTLGELANKLHFPMKEDAIAFATRNGWDYFVEEPAERRIKPRNYLDNFRTTRPQDEEKRPVA